MQPENKIELHVIFHGQVQGVFFRAYTKEYADRLNLTGTVQNLPDGTVEMVVQGEPSKIDQLFEKLTGPNGPGHVTRVGKSSLVINNELDTFKVLY